METDGLSINNGLRSCELVRERRITDKGDVDWLFALVGDRLIPLGTDEAFAKAFVYALRRNARCFDKSA